MRPFHILLVLRPCHAEIAKLAYKRGEYGYALFED